jgi:hypothetical protein
MTKVKYIIVICCILLSAIRSIVGCQGYKVNRLFTGTALNTMSGFSYGVGETLIHHHGTSIFASAPPTSFWGNRSWERKHRNYPLDQRPKFLGAKTFLAWTQDGYHLSRTTHRVLMNVSVVTYRPPQKKWHRVIDFIILQGAFSAGFHLSQLTLRR